MAIICAKMTKQSMVQLAMSDPHLSILGRPSSSGSGMVGLRVLRSVHECEPSPMYQFYRYIKLTRPSSHTAPRATAPHCKNASRCIIALVVRACFGCVMLSSEWLKAAPRYRAAPGSPRSRCWGVDCWYCCPAMRQLRDVRLSFSEIGVQLRPPVSFLALPASAKHGTSCDDRV